MTVEETVAFVSHGIENLERKMVLKTHDCGSAGSGIPVGVRQAIEFVSEFQAAGVQSAPIGPPLFPILSKRLQAVAILRDGSAFGANSHPLVIERLLAPEVQRYEVSAPYQIWRTTAMPATYYAKKDGMALD